MDSQELWIASVIGDAHFAGIHGLYVMYIMCVCAHAYIMSCYDRVHCSRMDDTTREEERRH